VVYTGRHIQEVYPRWYIPGCITVYMLPYQRCITVYMPPYQRCIPGWYASLVYTRVVCLPMYTGGYASLCTPVGMPPCVVYLRVVYTQEGCTSGWCITRVSEALGSLLTLLTRVLEALGNLLTLLFSKRPASPPTTRFTVGLEAGSWHPSWYTLGGISRYMPPYQSPFVGVSHLVHTRACHAHDLPVVYMHRSM